MNINKLIKVYKTLDDDTSKQTVSCLQEYKDLSDKINKFKQNLEAEISNLRITVKEWNMHPKEEGSIRLRTIENIYKKIDF